MFHSVKGRLKTCMWNDKQNSKEYLILLYRRMGLWAVVSVATVVVAAGHAQLFQNTLLLDPLLDNKVEKTCPTNWSTHQASCYKFIRSPVKTRAQARAQCKVRGGEGVINLNLCYYIELVFFYVF